ncbi:MAG: C-terminal target protein [Bacteroidetes bacterium]|nr:C-terminal target protein [Bacteroidota bacterium]
MKKRFLKVQLISFSALTLFVLFNSCSQTFCIKKASENIEGERDGYRYELWNQNSQGKACMTLRKGALFNGQWSNVENYLARRGLSYNQTQEHQEIGNFYATYDCNYKPSSKAGGNSYLSVYGWTIDPLIEFYIVEDWRNWMPAMSKDAIYKGALNVNGSIYDIYECTRINQPSIVGITTFSQYFSIRRDKRNRGTINISEHFNKWESLGLDMGKLHEVSFVVEGYHNSGKFSFNDLDIFVK